MTDRHMDGPVAQSLRIGFVVLQVATGLLALGWLVSNVRQVPPDTQAVVLRFGQVVRVQQAGLVLAWPRPIERVELLPGPQRQLNVAIVAGTGASQALVDPASRAAGEVPPPSAGVYLTGDGGVVLLDATVNYRVSDGAAYYLTAPHVGPALRRLFLADATALAASRSMDDFLVVRPERGIHDVDILAQDQAARQAIRGALAGEINRRLKALDAAGAGLGVEVTRIDITAMLPPAAKFAFDAVLDATQMAEQGLAAARTEAARTQQAADQTHDRLLAEARANADERVNRATAQGALMTGFEQHASAASRPSLLDQLYRERIAAILTQAGTVDTVDLRGGGRLILPGAQP